MEMKGGHPRPPGPALPAAAGRCILFAAARSHFQKVLDINPDLAEADFARKNILSIDAALR